MDRSKKTNMSLARDGIFLAAMFFGTTLLFLPATRDWFISYDDQHYVYDNPHVQAGLTWSTFIWAFTTFHAANWHPLTWLSHALDCELFGLNAGGHHLTSIVIHAVNALLLFLVLRISTSRVWPSALAAALFAWHPLRVESVAWAAERKDVLSGLFFLLALLAYSSNILRPASWKRAAVLAVFICGLLAKPMIVTLPFVLLLWDYWPMQRREGIAKLIVEKVPLIALSAISCVVTVIAQHAGGAIRPLGTEISLLARVLDGFRGAAWYVFKEAFPVRLSIMYPVRQYPLSETVPPAVLIAAISAIVIALRRKYPHLLMGWAWFLGMLVPVIGIVRIGEISMADRYTYLPGIGLAIMLAWAMADAARRSKTGVIVACVALLAACIVLTHRQVQTWYDTQSVYEQALAASEDNELARASIPHGRLERAERDYFASPGQLAAGWKAGGSSWDFLGRLTREQQVAYFHVIRGQSPGSAVPHINLGEAFFLGKDYANAMTQFALAVQIAPNDPVAQIGLAKSLVKMRRIAEGVEHARRVLELDPGNAEGAKILAENTESHK